MELLKKTDTFFLRTMNEQYERFITKYLFVLLLIAIFANIVNLLSHVCNIGNENRKDKPTKNSIGRTRENREMVG